MVGVAPVGAVGIVAVPAQVIVVRKTLQHSCWLGLEFTVGSHLKDLFAVIGFHLLRKQVIVGSHLPRKQTPAVPAALPVAPVLLPLLPVARAGVMVVVMVALQHSRWLRLEFTFGLHLRRKQNKAEEDEGPHAENTVGSQLHRVCCGLYRVGYVGYSWTSLSRVRSLSLVGVRRQGLFVF